MMNIDEQIERVARAERFRQAREKAGLGGVRKLASRFGWNENKLKGHDSGRNGFGIVDAKKYAKAFGVSLQWLYFGTGSPDDQEDEEPIATIDVPLISWVSAGAMLEQDGMSTFDDCPTITALDLPEGQWVALRVVGNSMNKVSPEGSIIFANLKDRRLVTNGYYIVADERGQSTYKRYRPNDDPPFQPYSTEIIPPLELDGAVNVIGRVRRTVFDM